MEVGCNVSQTNALSLGLLVEGDAGCRFGVLSRGKESEIMCVRERGREGERERGREGERDLLEWAACRGSRRRRENKEMRCCHHG
jgi:hypothetical protein